MNGDYVDVYGVTIRATTARAVLCRVRDIEFWTPRSQLLGDLYRGYRGSISVARWFIESKSLEWITDGGGQADDRDGEPSSSTIAVPALEGATRMYKRLAAEYHPDRNPRGGETMRALNQLWQAVLGDMRAGR
jgi:hypothetical protein